MIRSTKLKAVVLAMALAVLGLWGASAAAQEPTSQPAQTPPADVDPTVGFEGKFVYAGGQKQKDKIQQAIEAGTEDMNFVTRPIARSRLEDTNPVYGALTISLAGDKISVKRDNITPIVTPASGAAGSWTSPEGETYNVTAKLKDRSITQSFAAGDGKKVIVYTLSKDGKSLTVSVTVTSGKLPGPIKYSLSYKKS